MAGNSIGKLFQVTTFGESHGLMIGAVVDGCPPGLELTEQDIQHDLDRRRPGQSSLVSQRKESDTIKIVSGVFEGKTTGTAIGLLIENTDQKPKDYDEIKEVFRPGHADFTYQHKYGIRDYRGGGRSSARETAMRVAAGAIARKFLSQLNIQIRACVTQIGEHEIPIEDWQQVDNNPLYIANADKVKTCEDYIKAIRKSGDSIGAKVYVEAIGVPVGLGEPVFDRLDADIAHALMSINAVKAVEIGAGMACVKQKGSEHRDPITPQGFTRNQAGGILGGISSGQAITANIAVKPASSILIPEHTIDTQGQATEVVTKGRHDPCVGIRAVPIAEAMLALVLMDHYLRYRGQIGQVE